LLDDSIPSPETHLQEEGSGAGAGAGAGAVENKSAEIKRDGRGAD